MLRGPPTLLYIMIGFVIVSFLILLFDYVIGGCPDRWRLEELSVFLLAGCAYVFDLSAAE